MIPPIHLYAAAVVASTSLVSAHIAYWTEAMWGFNITGEPNRPVDPLMGLPFDQWWFHGHLNYPPHADDIVQLPVGGTSPSQLSCDKDATTYYTSGPGGDQRNFTDPDSPCPGSGIAAYHTSGINDLGGCALAVAYKSDASEVLPEDFIVFSVNQTCVWYMHTDFQIPEEMPPCPNGKCTCAWFWMHEPDSGSEQMYMNGFQCNFTGATSNKTLGSPQVPRRCGPEAKNGFTWNLANCTSGPQQPLYWLQREGNNMFEDYYDPPTYTDKYRYLDGAQTGLFVGEYNTSYGNGNLSSPVSASSSGPATQVLIATQISSPSSLQGTQTSSPPSPSNTSVSMSMPDDGGHPCSDSGDVSNSSQPPSSLPTTGTADARAQTTAASSSAPLTVSGTSSALPSFTQNALDSNATASNSSSPSSIPPTASSDPAAQLTSTPGGTSLPQSVAAEPTTTTHSGGPHGHHHHHWNHWHHGRHGYDEKRTDDTDDIKGVRRGWGIQHRRSAGKRQA